MKRANKIKLVIFLTIILSPFWLSSQVNSFYVYFKQNDIKKNIKSAEVEMLKKPFKIYIEYTQKVDLTVHSSFSGSEYNDAVKGKLMDHLINTENQKAKISFFKSKNLIQTDEKRTFIWEKEKTDSDSIKKNGTRYVSVKNVEKIIVPKVLETGKDKSKGLIDISTPIQFVMDDLHLVFIYSETDKSGEKYEIQREIVKIKWVEEYKEETKRFKKTKKKADKEKVRAAKRQLEYNQKQEKKEKKRLEKLDKSKKQKEEKKEKKLEKKKNKKEEEVNK